MRKAEKRGEKREVSQKKREDLRSHVEVAAREGEKEVVEEVVVVVVVEAPEEEREDVKTAPREASRVTL